MANGADKAEVQAFVEQYVVGTCRTLEVALLLWAACVALAHHTAEAVAAFVILYLLSLMLGAVNFRGRPYATRFIRNALLSALGMVYWQYLRTGLVWSLGGSGAEYYLNLGFWLTLSAVAGGMAAILELYRNNPSMRPAAEARLGRWGGRSKMRALGLLVAVSAALAALPIVAFCVPAIWTFRQGQVPWNNAGILIPLFFFIFEAVSALHGWGQTVLARMIAVPASVGWLATRKLRFQVLRFFASVGFLACEAFYIAGIAGAMVFLPVLSGDETLPSLAIYVGPVPLLLMCAWLLCRIVRATLMLRGVLKLSVQQQVDGLMVRTAALNRWHGPHKMVLTLFIITTFYGGFGYILARTGVGWPALVSLIAGLLLVGFLPWTPTKTDPLKTNLLPGFLYLLKKLSVRETITGFVPGKTRALVLWLSAIVVGVTLIETVIRTQIITVVDEAAVHLQSGQLAAMDARIADSAWWLSAYRRATALFHMPSLLTAWTNQVEWQATQIDALAGFRAGDYGRAHDRLSKLLIIGSGLASPAARVETALLRSQMEAAIGSTGGRQNAIALAEEFAQHTLNRPYWTALATLGRARAELDADQQKPVVSGLDYVERVGRQTGSYQLVVGAREALADVFSKAGKHPKALHLYRESGELANNHGAVKDAARLLLKSAMTERQLGDTNSAVADLSRVVSLGEGTLSTETLWSALYQRGLIEQQQGKPPAAKADYMRALEVIEAVRGSLPGAEERTRYLAAKLPVYEHLVLLTWLSGDTAGAFEFVQRAKARAFLDLLGTRKIRYRDEDRALGEEERLLQWKIQALLERIWEEQAKPARLQNGKMAEWRKELTRAHDDHQKLLVRIKATNPKLASLTTAPIATLRQVQGALDEKEALLEYFVTEDRTLLWVLTRSAVRTIDIPVGRGHLAALVEKARNSIVQGNIYDVSSARRLYTLILEPALTGIGSASRLIVAAHDVLHMMPFDALVIEANGPTYVGDRWVSSQYESGSILVLNRTYRAHTASRGPVLFGLGDPVFQPDDERYGPPAIATGRASHALTRRVWLNVNTEQAGYQPWHRLPATGPEVQQIAALLAPFGEADVRLGGQATEESVKSADHGRYLYEHYATHGALAGDVPNLREPALVLSLPQTAQSVEDGYLTMSEIFGLRLGAELVTLSACNTRMGEAVPGEGLIGLTRAFYYAGTPSVVASLWSVADESTAELMVSFYRYLRDGKSKAEALTLAKRELRHAPRYSNPFFWAPFVLVGEG